MGCYFLPHPGVEPTSPALACGFLTTEPPGEPRTCARDLEITTISKYRHVLRIEAEDITYEFGQEWGAPFKPLQHLSLSQGMNTQHVQRTLVFQEGLLTASVCLICSWKLTSW